MDYYILLAKNAVERYIKEGETISPPQDLPPEFFQKKSGIFITIKKEGTLRGCIGTFLPTKENIAQEIIANAISAASKDYRFGAVSKEELPLLSYTIYILNKPQAVSDLKELNPKEYGIIVKNVPLGKNKNEDVVFNGRLPIKTGLLLPDLPKIDSIKKQFWAACEKAGIDPKKEKFFVYKFSVEKHVQEEKAKEESEKE